MTVAPKREARKEPMTVARFARQGSPWRRGGGQDRNDDDIVVGGEGGVNGGGTARQEVQQ